MLASPFEPTDEGSALTERVIVLRSSPALRDLDPSELTALARTMTAQSFSKGQVMLHESEPSESFFLIREGRVSIERGGRPYAKITGPGAAGIIPFFAKSQTGTRIVAETHVDAFAIDAEAMVEVYEDHFTAALTTLRFLSLRLVEELSAPLPPAFQVSGGPFSGGSLGDGLKEGEKLDLVRRVLLMRGMRAFNRANINAVTALVARQEEHHYAAGDVIWTEGDPSDVTLFLVRGAVRQTWGDGLSRDYRPLAALGGADALAQIPRWNTMTALEPSLALRWHREQLFDVLEDNPDMTIAFIAMFATSLLGFWDARAVAQE